MSEIYQWGDLMEAAEYLWVPPKYNVKLKSTLKCRIKLIKMPVPGCFMLVLKEMGCETSRNIWNQYLETVEFVIVSASILSYSNSPGSESGVTHPLGPIQLGNGSLFSLAMCESAPRGARPFPPSSVPGCGENGFCFNRLVHWLSLIS